MSTARETQFRKSMYAHLQLVRFCSHRPLLVCCWLHTGSALFASVNVQVHSCLLPPPHFHGQWSLTAALHSVRSTPLRFHCEVILVEVQASALTLHGTENASRLSLQSSCGGKHPVGFVRESRGAAAATRLCCAGAAKAALTVVISTMNIDVSKPGRVS